jgi:hypothetical protein
MGARNWPALAQVFHLEHERWLPWGRGSGQLKSPLPLESGGVLGRRALPGVAFGGRLFHISLHSKAC